MPIYNYRCNLCSKHFERIMKFSEMHDDVNCPDCKKPSERMITTFGHYTQIKNNGSSVRPKNVASGGKKS